MASLSKSQINSIMNKVIIYAGRFHPFHKGHLASYNYLTKHFGEDSVYIATSNTQSPSTSPFSFEETKNDGSIRN
jgi:nicotinic acid mononucleotide adenylyltransferase